jgi:hypothetical protein
VAVNCQGAYNRTHLTLYSNEYYVVLCTV